MKLKNIVFLGLLLIVFISVGLNFTGFKQHILKPIITKFYIEPFRDGEMIDEHHVIATLDNGMPIVVNKEDDCVCWHVRFEGYWDPSELSILRKIIRPGFSIAEAGANFGVHTLVMSQLVGEGGHVYAFEANSRVSEYLKKSVDLNSLKNVTVYETGLGNQNDALYLNFDPKNIGGGALSSTPSTNTVRAKTARLDDILENVKVDVLKIDTEGYEGKILEGATLLIKKNPNLIIIMEWSQDALRQQESNPEALLLFLKDQGFVKVWKIGDRHSAECGKLVPITFKEIQAIPYCDLVFAKQDLNL